VTSSVIQISIHAPAWGATVVPQALSPYLNISIHAPAWGATGQTVKSGPDNPKFQSTLPRGERLVALTQPLTLSKISIHAPAWGATLNNVQVPKGEKISIHAPAWGATTETYEAMRLGLFQSTLPRGERPFSF